MIYGREYELKGYQFLSTQKKFHKSQKDFNDLPNQSFIKKEMKQGETSIMEGNMNLRDINS